MSTKGLPRQIGFVSQTAHLFTRRPSLIKRRFRFVLLYVLPATNTLARGNAGIHWHGRPLFESRPLGMWLASMCSSAMRSLTALYAAIPTGKPSFLIKSASVELRLTSAKNSFLGICQTLPQRFLGMASVVGFAPTISWLRTKRVELATPHGRPSQA